MTTNPHGYPIDERVGLVDLRAALLADAGYVVEAVEPPPITTEPARGDERGITEIKLTLDESVRRHGSDELGAIFDAYYDMGELLDLAGYRAVLSDRTRMMRAWSLFQEDHPLVLSPLLMRAWFPWDYDADRAPRTCSTRPSTATASTSSACPPASCPWIWWTACPSASSSSGRATARTVLDAMEAVESRAGSVLDRLWSTWPA